MHDSEVVAAIVAGDPDGLAEAYDKYASPLYSYCRSLLREPADAADAVQDTFVIAAARLEGLRDRDRLRPWLYAVARNECRRRLRASGTEISSAPDEVPEPADEADITGGAERAELRALVRSAIRGLGDADRDLVELQLRQGLDAGEVGAALGVSRNHAHALLSRARRQLEISLGVLLVARSGRQDCPALDAMLQGWDGQLTVLIRKRINRHIERCPACTERRRRELVPAQLIGLAPLAALPLAAPHALKEQVLRLVSSDTPEAAARRAEVLRRTQAFGPHGFPRPSGPRHRWRPSRAQAAAAGAVAAAAVAVLTTLALSGGAPARHAAAGPPGASGTGAPGASGTGAPGSQAAPGPSGGSAAHPGPGHGSTPQPVVPVVHVSPGPVPDGSPAPSPRGSSPGPRPSSPSPSGSSPSGPSPSRSPAPTPSRTPSTSPPPPPPKPGTLSVSPTSVLLSPLLGGSVTLTASGGPVTWSITEGAGLIGRVSVSPSSGTLAAGQSVTVSLRVTTLVAVASQLTVNPGGIAIEVVIGLGVG